MAWYKTGTVSVQNGQTSITGVSTKFASNTRVGDGFRGPDGEWYEIVNIASETVLGIYPAYQGPTVSTSPNYMVAPLQGYNKESADRLREITNSFRDVSDEVQAAIDAAAAAKVSENASKASETNAGISATQASQSAAQVATDASQVAQDKTQAQEAAVSAGQSRDSASTSATQAGESATSAHTSEINAKTSETNADQKSTEASNSAASALSSAQASAGSETAARNSETASKESETNAALSATTSTQSKDESVAAKVAAEQARDEAVAAAGTVVGGVTDMGTIDLSSGQYPPKPPTSSFWRVTVGGTVNGITFAVGDTLNYSKPTDEFYKVDNSGAVRSVNNMTGDVVLSKSDLDLGNVDNTSDANKPVSTAQQTAINGRQASNANLTAFSGLTGAVDRLPYFTGAGALSLTTLTEKARTLLAYTTNAQWQSGLGLVPISSTTDLTAGRLLTAGFNGVGGPLFGVQGTPAAQIARNAGATFSYLSANDKPAGMVADGALITLGANADYAFQLACDWRTGSLYTQYKGGAALSGWNKILSQGDFGYAANDGADLPGGSWNGILRSGKYRFQPGNTNGPGSGAYFGTVDRNAYQISTGTWTELTQSSQEPRAWLRSSINNVASQHYEIFTAYNALLDPQTAGGLMSSTMVSGWRVEKFANGTCIVTGSGSSASYAVNQYSGTTIPIPSVFYAEAEVLPIVAVLPAGNDDYYPANAYMTGGLTSLYILLRNGSTGAQVLNLRIKLIGRWKA